MHNAAYGGLDCGMKAPNPAARIEKKRQIGVVLGFAAGIHRNCG